MWSYLNECLLSFTLFLVSYLLISLVIESDLGVSPLFVFLTDCLFFGFPLESKGYGP